MIALDVLTGLLLAGGLFFFVAGQNILGMIPGVHGIVETATATGTATRPI